MIGQAERLIELNRLKAQQGKSRGGAQLIAFSSGKGGTGKTFVSLNTAFALSRLNKKVLLIDMDTNMSNINIMLNVRAKKTLIDFYLHKCALNELITPMDNSLHFIYGDSGRSDYPNPGQREIDYLASCIRDLSYSYDFIILDVGAGASDETIHLLTQADRNIIITNPEPTAVMDAYVIIKSLNLKGVSSSKFIIVNKCYTSDEAVTTFNNLSKISQHFLKEKIALLGYVENDPMVSRAIMAQQLFLKMNPHNRASQQLLKIAQNIIKAGLRRS